MERNEKPDSYWQLIFKQSPVNGALYRGEELRRVPWDWPRDTYLDRRLRQKREQARCLVPARMEIDQQPSFLR